MSGVKNKNNFKEKITNLFFEEYYEYENDIDYFIDIIKVLLIEKQEISFNNELYVKFQNGITKYIYDNDLDSCEDWLNITNTMIYKSNEVLSEVAANNILMSLQNIKRIVLKNKVNEKGIFLTVMHPVIVKVSMDKYFDGYYADAVESAFKEVNSRCKSILRKVTGEEKDGAQLMNYLFSINSPIVVFENMRTESGKNVQNGYMQIFAGAMIGIRNPKAHENTHLTELEAFRRLSLASLLMEKLDKATIKNKKVK